MANVTNRTSSADPLAQASTRGRVYLAPPSVPTYLKAHNPQGHILHFGNVNDQPRRKNTFAHGFLCPLQSEAGWVHTYFMICNDEKHRHNNKEDPKRVNAGKRLMQSRKTQVNMIGRRKEKASSGLVYDEARSNTYILIVTVS